MAAGTEDGSATQVAAFEKERGQGSGAGVVAEPIVLVFETVELEIDQVVSFLRSLTGNYRGQSL